MTSEKTLSRYFPLAGRWGAAWAAGLLVLAPSASATPAPAQDLPAGFALTETRNLDRDDSRRCLNCHGQEHIATLSPGQRRAMVAAESDFDVAAQPAARPGLYVSPDAFTGTVHAEASCIACHADAAELPHARQLEQATCTAGCHTLAGIDYRRGAHAQAEAEGDELAPSCVTCHGGHDVLPVSDRRSPAYPLNVVQLCADCHEKHHEPTSNGQDQKEHIEGYLESVHGQAVSGSGLIVSATCASCHGSHAVLPSSNPDSTVHRDRIADTCGDCHLGVEETYLTSIHGQAQRAGDPEAPVCSDCHASHAITRASTPNFMLDLVNECGHCHNKPVSEERGGASLYDTYRRSYHGQVAQLGSMRAARCSDCHGAHDILAPDDPASRLSGQARIETCADCHPGANANFVQYQAHADFHDYERYPLLHGVWLYFMIVMSATFTFFGVHTLMWFIRSSIDRLRHGPTPRPAANPHAIRRFTLMDRINHAFVMITFFGLTLTGMPLLFSDQTWAKWFTAAMGGAHAAGIWHRFFAVLLIINFAVHFVSIAMRLRGMKLRDILHGPNSLMPRWKDVTDCLGMFRWFLGGKKKPPFDRWTYWEKFDYWAEIFGTLVIGGSGLLLWFPIFFSQWLPGWAFNVATIIHGYEALLAVGFIFTIHFFNANLRWEKFPVDDVMFTGQLPEEEFQHERPEEYARLAERNELAAVRVPAAPRWQRPVATALGLLAMGVGIGTLVLMVLAGAGLI